MGNENVIEFNGKRYDAITGRLLGKSHADIVEPLAPPRPLVSRQSIDGVVRHKQSKPAEVAHPRAIHAPGSAVHRKSRQPGEIIKPHRPQTAKTLMRRAVHKPTATLKPTIKPQNPAEVMAKPISAIAVRHSVHHVDPVRKQRARQTPRSQAVRRFAAQAQDARPQLPQPMPLRHPRQAARPTVRPQTIPHAKPDIFEAAIARANSHEQPKVKHRDHKNHKRRRLAGLMAAFTAIIFFGGVLAYLNLASIELKIASVQAGFNAQLPSHKPTGYDLTDIQNRPGQIILRYRSGDRSYQITQQPTDWNSQTLGDSIIPGGGSQPIQIKGRTVYIYEGIASWVSGGVRYDITGNADFDASEIAAIAGSM